MFDDHPSGHRVTQLDGYAVRPARAAISTLPPAEKYGASTRQVLTELGYGEEEIGKRKGTTVAINGAPVLFRRAFDVPADLVNQKGATFRLAVASDNSAEVYVNGQKADADPEADHEFRYWNREVELPVKLLRPGRNVIAVLVKNADGSSDLYLDVKVTAQAPVKK